jgi:hypothetical protein
VAASPSASPKEEPKEQAPAPAASEAPNASPTPAASPAYGDYPAKYKEIVAAWVTANIPEQSAAHIEWQTEPKPSDLPTAKGRHVFGYLVLFNSPPHPGDTPKSHSALIRDGKVVSMSGFDD